MPIYNINSGPRGFLQAEPGSLLWTMRPIGEATGLSRGIVFAFDGKNGIRSTIPMKQPTQVGTPLIVPSVNGPALSLDGSSYLDFGIGLNLLPSSAMPFTFSFWEQVGASPNTYCGVFTFRAVGATNPWGFFRTKAGGGSTWEPMYFGSYISGAQFSASSNTNVLVAGERHRWLVVCREGASSSHGLENDIWMDGVQYPTTSSGNVGSRTTDLNYIGYEPVDSPGTYKGLLSDIVLWNRTLSVSEIKDYFASPMSVWDRI